METLLEASPETTDELLIPPVLYHTAPRDRHQSIAENGIIPRDDPRNPGGVSGVAQSAEYNFPGRNYLSVSPWTQQEGENVIYAVDTSLLDPNLVQVDEDNYPLGSDYREHRPELDTPENINKAFLNDKQPSASGVAGYKQTVAYQGVIPPEALVPIDAYVMGSGDIRRGAEVPRMLFQSQRFKEFLDQERVRRAVADKERQEKADTPATLIP